MNRFADEINGIRLRKATIDFMKVYFNMDLEIEDEDETGGQINMCRAVTMMRRSSYNSGMRKGIEQGKLQGIEQGIEQGKLQGIYSVIKNALRKKMKLEDIQEITGLTYEKIADFAQSLENAKA